MRLLLTIECSCVLVLFGLFIGYFIRDVSGQDFPMFAGIVALPLTIIMATARRIKEDDNDDVGE